MCLSNFSLAKIKINLGFWGFIGVIVKNEDNLTYQTHQCLVITSHNMLQQWNRDDRLWLPFGL